MSQKFLDAKGLIYLVKIINNRINDVVAKGMHSCAACGAPYTGKATCEYCGRGFFVDYNMYRWDELWTNN